MASKTALAVADGAPADPYGPISLGLRYQYPGITSPEVVKRRLALSPLWDSFTPGAATAGERSGSPVNGSVSNVTGTFPFRLTEIPLVSVGTT